MLPKLGISLVPTSDSGIFLINAFMLPSLNMRSILASSEFNGSKKGLRLCSHVVDFRKGARKNEEAQCGLGELPAAFYRELDNLRHAAQSLSSMKGLSVPTRMDHRYISGTIEQHPSAEVACIGLSCFRIKSSSFK